MKRFLTILTICTIALVSCKKDDKKETVVAPESQKIKENIREFIGTQFEVKRAKPISEIQKGYDTLKPLDTLYTAFRAKVDKVCQAKGCWMQLTLDDEREVMVKFKDYGFFVPKDLAGKQVTVNGYAFVEEMSVEDQKHYAEDEGATKQEIDQITAPKKTYSFIADGVLLDK